MYFLSLGWQPFFCLVTPAWNPGLVCIWLSWLQVEFFSTSVEVKHGNRGVMIVKFPDGKISGNAFACFEK